MIVGQKYGTGDNPTDLDIPCRISDIILFLNDISVHQAVHLPNYQIEHDDRQDVADEDYDHPEVVDVRTSAQYADVVDEVDLRHDECSSGELEQRTLEHIFLEHQYEHYW